MRLEDTDWGALETATGDGAFLPVVLTRLLDPEPAVRAAAIGELEPVCHQNSFYAATAPVARYVAAILTHPVCAETVPGRGRDRPMTAVLLDWLAERALDAADDPVYPAMSAFRDLRPGLYRTVAGLLDHEDPEVSAAALAAALQLSEHPGLVAHRAGLAERARRHLATGAPARRAFLLSTLRSRGHDTTPFETLADFTLRARSPVPGPWSGPHGDTPPF